VFWNRIFLNLLAKKSFIDMGNSLTRTGKLLSIVQSKMLRRSLPWVLSFVVGLVLRPYLQETIKQLVEKHSAAMELTYEVSSVAHYQKFELAEVAKSQGVDFFDLKLDDPFLSGYHLAKIKLRNTRKTINSSLRFEVSTETRLAKIIDVKFKIIRPVNKSVAVVHSLPNLTWALPKVLKPEISWEEGEPGEVAGYYLYRSFIKDRGYGRVKHELLTEPSYQFEEINVENLSRVYYRVSAVSTSRIESGLSESIPFPDLIGLAPYFKDSASIFPDENREKLSKSNRFASLSKAMAKSSPSTIYIVHKKRKDIVDKDNLSNDPRVFYDDDMEFLKGKMKISLLDGIDEDGEIDILVLYKLLPGETGDLNLKLEGMTGISLRRVGKTQSETIQIDEKKNTQQDKKRLLTPTEVKTYLGKGIIFLIWKKPEGSDYKGVRIFRSKKRNWENLNNLGEELYRGPGFSQDIECGMKHLPPIGKSRGVEQTKRYDAHSFRPPLTKEEEEAQRPKSLQPSPPRGLRLVGMRGKAEGELNYGDYGVSPNTVYTYTLIAFDRNNNYSYPILFDASLDSSAEETDCTAKEPILPRKDNSTKIP
jgi:hypothetical protein